MSALGGKAAPKSAQTKIDCGQVSRMLLLGVSNVEYHRFPGAILRQAGLARFTVVYETALCSPRAVALYQRVPAS
jgi:hypothetical protein